VLFTAQRSSRSTLTIPWGQSGWRRAWVKTKSLGFLGF